MNKEARTQYPLRLPESLKNQVDDLAHSNRRSTNAELVVLIEDGIKYRKLQEIGYVR
ncbi:MAG: Arc family DNA-binding protein [Pseudomonas sp.]|nr:Arc family DNA-binding protein [Pseudomonas sp.]